MGRVVGLNLAVLLAVSVLAFAFTALTSPSSPDPYHGLTYAFLVLLAGVVQLGLLLLLGVFYLLTDRKPLGRALLLSALVVLLVGTSFCFGGLVALDFVV